MDAKRNPFVPGAGTPPPELAGRSGIITDGEVAIARAARGKVSCAVAPFRDGLIKKGMIFSRRHGETAFTVPMFDEFLRRTSA